MLKRRLMSDASGGFFEKGDGVVSGEFFCPCCWRSSERAVRDVLLPAAWRDLLRWDCCAVWP